MKRLESKLTRSSRARGDAGRWDRLVACVLLSVLIARLPASAQDVMPNVADAASEGTPAASELTPALPAPPVLAAEAVPPTAPFVAPGATEAAWRELHETQLKESELWRHRPPSMALPAVTLTLGLASFSVMLPAGSIMVASLRAGGEASEQERTMRIGVPLLVFGLLGFAAMVASATAVAKIRRKRARWNAEIKALVERRTLLETLLEGQWRTTFPSQQHH